MPQILTMPDALYGFSAMRFSIVTRNAVSEASNFTQEDDVDGPSYARWVARFTFSPREDEQLDELDRFITRLKGGLVLCRFYDLRKSAGPRGAGGVGATVNVATSVLAGATSVVLKNLMLSEAVAFDSMDNIQLGDNLHTILNPGASDVSGQGAFEIWPPTRRGHSTDEAVPTVKPTGVFRLDDGQDGLTIMPPMTSGDLTLSFTEKPQRDA